MLKNGNRSIGAKQVVTQPRNGWSAAGLISKGQLNLPVRTAVYRRQQCRSFVHFRAADEVFGRQQAEVSCVGGRNSSVLRYKVGDLIFSPLLS